jgi:nicotinate dehydrogenase subunit B
VSAPGQLRDWLRFEADGTVTVFSGKVEIGQGIATALAQCVADELEVGMDRIGMAVPDTDNSPDEGFTAGSRSIEQSGQLLRRITAQARTLMVDRAARTLGVDLGSLTLADGRVRAPDGRSLTYAQLADDELLAHDAIGAEPKPASARRVVGTAVPRLDLPGKVNGAPSFVQDIALPGMMHGRVVRPPSPGARLVDVDIDELRALPGVVAVVRDGSFLGLVASDELSAFRARQRALRIATWKESATLPATNDPRYLLKMRSVESVAAERHAANATKTTKTVEGEFTRPFLAHGAVAPSCAVARLDGTRYTVWSHGQGIHPLRYEIAKVLEVALDDVTVIHGDGAGCYGHNGADDVALDAALLARAVPGRPVRLQWMRDDEFAWEPYGTATVVRISASLDQSGRIASWTHEQWGHGHGNRPREDSPSRKSSLLAAHHLARPFEPTVPPAARSLTTGALRNALPLYTIPEYRVVDHYVPEQPLRVSALRSLGAHPNVFAIESVMDELAEAAGEDAASFRLRHLEDPRARAVIEDVTQRSGWSAGRGGDMRGLGLGFARYKNASAYFACVAEVKLDEEIRVTRVWGAIDSGMAVNPDGIRNQAEGGIVQAVSWTLKEQVVHDGTRIETRGWDSYPTLPFSEVPEVDVRVFDRPDEPPLGTGEAFAGPVSGAIANAVYAAAGIRLRDLPFTRARVIAALG